MELTDALFGSGTPNYGALAQKSEKKRQGIINLGMQQLDAVYGGGSAPFYTLAKQPGSQFSGKNTYYSLTGKGFQPYWVPRGARPSGTTSTSGTGAVLSAPDPFMPGKPFVAKALGLDKLFGKSESPRDIAKKAFRRGQLFNAPTVQTFKGYQPEFYDAREKAYTDFALPQLADQYQQARDHVIYGLSNTGLSGSTEATKAKFKLEKAMASGKQNVADEAINQGNQLRNQVEQSRQQAIQQLYQTGDPTQALKTAINTSASFERPSTFAPLAQGFGDVLNQFYIQKLLQGYQNPVAGNNNPTYFAPV